MIDFRRAYFENLKDQRRELQDKTSLIGPSIGAALTLLSVGIAIAGVSITAPVLSMVGLAVALAGVPITTKAFVERSLAVEKLKRLDGAIDQIETENRREIEARSGEGDGRPTI